MGCGISSSKKLQLKKCEKAMRAAVLIQRWYRQQVARMELRRRCTWNIFQSIEYAGEQDQIKNSNEAWYYIKGKCFNRILRPGVCKRLKPLFPQQLNAFFGYLMEHFTPANSERKLISQIFRENEVCRDPEWERCFNYMSIELPQFYSGPHLIFPLTVAHAAELVEAFRNKQHLHSRYVIQLLLETWKVLRNLPNINNVSTCQSKEIIICGDLHGQLDDLLLVFYKNGLPSVEKPYVFNGDFVDRGKNSLEILFILFTFLLVYPNDIHLNRGNHEDQIMNLRYGFTKEVLMKYRLHGKRILKLLHKIFSWLPLATVIDEKVLIAHGGISDSTDLSVIATLARHKYVSTLRPPEQKQRGESTELGGKAAASSLKGAGSGLIHVSPRRSLQELCSHSSRSVDEELRGQRQQAGLGLSHEHLFGHLTPSSHSDSCKEQEASDEEWKQIVDLLWSDPMPQDGCISNDLRGGGCYWGPDVTEGVLGKHDIQLLIRSHECKQDGYEFCHNRRVLTVFSASNYYEVGSNRGACVRLGPDLVPHIIQYQSNCTTRKFTLRQSVGQTERSALRALREELFAHRSGLISAFQEFDPEKTGWISLNNWAVAVENVLQLNLPWRVLRSQLVTTAHEGQMHYRRWFRELAIKEPNTAIPHQNLLETMYRHHSNLETIFRIIDTDHSGLISLEEFHQTWKLLSSHLSIEVSDEAIADLLASIDFNKDGSIDINEFMEAFRLVDRSKNDTDETCLGQNPKCYGNSET